jgi:SAM-dependent methyltransferase
MHHSKQPESIQPARKSKDEVQKYWRDSHVIANSGHLHGGGLSEYLVSLAKQYVKPDASIVELGCNTGRNLYQLWKAGYRDLSGVEINPAALELMKQTFPDMKLRTYKGSIEDRVRDLEEHDLVFTVATLEHIHSDSEWVFAEITLKAKKYLITIEGEEKVESELHFPRNYKNIFEGLGMQQVYEKQLSGEQGLSTKLYARVFSKNSN